jgi:two-component system, OmpR family, sensor kinase
MIKSLRLQLTIWYLVFFSALVVIFCLVLYGALARALERSLDEGITSEAHTAAALMQEELDEMHGDGPRAAMDVLSEMQPRAGVIGIFEGTRILAASGPMGDPQRLETGARKMPESLDAIWAIPEWGRNGARAAAHPFRWADRQFTVFSAASLDSTAQELHALREALWLALPPLLALAALCGYLLTRRGLAPLGAMAAQTQRISSENLSTRLKIGNAAEELASLAASFNALLSRLDQSFESMRRFVQDASHEIRTPLAVIRGEAEVALAKERSPSEYQESLAVIHEESRRLSRLVEDLLNLARADAGRVQLRVEELYLNELVADCCRSMESQAAARSIQLQCGAREDVAVRGDEELLRRMVLNLLDNAVRYTPPGGKVSASVEARDGEVRVCVADTGVGIAPEAAAHVFERFYRVDQARSRQKPGAAPACFGLGLSIVKWIAESHHGTVELTSQPGTGSTFTVRLRYN